MKKNKLFSGETLIEVVLAIGLAVMVLFALVILGSSSVKTSTSSTRRAEAEKLSSSGVEAIRYFRDSSGFGSLANNCYRINSSGSGVDALDCTLWDSITLGIGNTFERKIQVEDYVSTGMRKVKSTTRWLETGGAGGYKQVVISTVLTKW